MKTKKQPSHFPINDNYRIVCYWINTSYGFKHEAVLISNYREVCKAKVCYYNRTWESFEYETVIDELLKKSELFSKDEIKSLLSMYQKNEYDKINKEFAFIGAIAKLNDLMIPKIEDKNRSNKTLLETIPGLQFPDNWDELPETEKQNRLNNTIKFLNDPLK